MMQDLETRERPDDAKLGCHEIRIGVSSCLLGEAVRYNGGHQQDRFLTGTLARLVRFVPVCPEVELGLGVPRPTLRLVESAVGVRLAYSDGGADITDAMRVYAHRRVDALETEDLSGYILKAKSPSCGMERVKVYSPAGMPEKAGRGVFADVLMERMPALPVEEEGRLHDPALRENFFERVFAYRRRKDLFSTAWTLGDLVRFHTREKLLLLAHEPEGYKHLGRLVGDASSKAREELRREYEARHGAALEKRATRVRHVNVLQHAAGYASNQLASRERAELTRLIEEYGSGTIPRVVPVTLIRHLALRFGIDYLLDQHYFSPHPRELMLQNHA